MDAKLSKTRSPSPPFSSHHSRVRPASPLLFAADHPAAPRAASACRWRVEGSDLGSRGRKEGPRGGSMASDIDLEGQGKMVDI